MPKRIEFQGQLHEFPDEFNDDQIRDALERYQKPEIPQTSEMLGPFIRGFGSSFPKTAVGTMELGQQIPGIGKAFPTPPEFLKRAATAPPEPGGQLGQMAGDILQFFLPGPAEAKVMEKVIGATGAMRGAGAIRAAAQAGLGAASMGTLTAMQTGKPEEGAKAALIGGVFSGLGRAGIEGFRYMRRAAADLPALGQEFDVPMTKAQQTQGLIPSAMESLVRRSILGSGVFQRFDQEVNKRLIRAGQSVADWISTNNMSSREAGEYIQKALQQVDDTAGQTYGAVTDAIAQQAGTVPLEVTGNLAATARKLLTEWKKPTEFAPGTRSVEQVNTAIGILEDFANPTVTKAVPAKPASAVLNQFGQPAIPAAPTATVQTTKELTWQEAKNLRTLLYKISKSGDMNIGKGALSQLNKALDLEMQTALAKAGRQDLAQEFRKASDGFKHTMDLFENSVIESIRKTDRPEIIVESLLNRKNAETGMGVLRQLVKDPRKQADIEAAIWSRILAGAEKEGVLIGDSLNNTLFKLGEPATKVLFPGAKLDKIQRFVKLADTISLRSSLTKPLSAQNPTLMAMAQSSQYIGMGAALTFSPQGWMIASGILLAPYTLAKMMTRSGAVELATKALVTPAASKAGLNISNRLAAIATEEMRRSVESETKRETAPTKGAEAVPQENIRQMIEQEADKQNVPRPYALALAESESSFQHLLEPGPKGELGVMQIIPKTADYLKVDPRDLRQNIEGGIRLLSQKLRQHKGNVLNAYADYKGGVNVPKAMEKARLAYGIIQKYMTPEGLQFPQPPR